ncbi:MAG TPA: mechanosensitive ion channel family protein [Candidatus Limnocylindrales bacterium]|nr:mechanosensitive ion channel family protein [Candidatus Limnocylindrales bacterium]
MFGAISDFWSQNQNATWVHFLEGFILFTLIVVVSGYIRRFARRQFKRAGVDPQVSVLAVRLIYLASLVVAVIAFFSVALNNAALVFGSFGVFALAFSLAFQDILKNFIAGVFLLLERPFRIGDEITADNHTGVVENVEMRTTTLRTEEGEEVLIPNSLVYTSTIVNRTRFPARQFTVATKVPDSVPLDGLADRVRDRVKSLKEILADPPPIVVVAPAADGGVALEVRYWLDYRQHDPLSVRNAVSQVVVRELQAGSATPARS